MTFPRALVFSGGNETPEPAPIPTGAWRGQLVILGPNDHFPTGKPGKRDRRFFIDELDVVWDVDPNGAEWVLRQYFERGYNEVISGPCTAIGYGGVYPNTDWRGSRWKRYLQFVKRVHQVAATVGLKITFTYVALPDFGEHFDGTGHGWNLDVCERDFGSLYSELSESGMVHRMQMEWEQYGSGARTAEAAEWCASKFPTQRRSWHSPWGHLWPCRGDEPEAESSRPVYKWLHENDLQSIPHGFEVPQHPGQTIKRTHKEQLVYDLWDMQRRFLGSCPVPARLLAMEPHLDPRSPNGAPILGADGQPIQGNLREDRAFDLWTDPTATEDDAREYGAAGLEVHGVVNLGDGAPR